MRYITKDDDDNFTTYNTLDAAIKKAKDIAKEYGLSVTVYQALQKISVVHTVTMEEIKDIPKAQGVKK